MTVRSKVSSVTSMTCSMVVLMLREILPSDDQATGAAHHGAQRLDPLRLFPPPGRRSVVAPV